MARKFCVYNTKTDEIITMPYIGAENLHIVADKMFYLNKDGSFLTMNLDGSNKKTF